MDNEKYVLTFDKSGNKLSRQIKNTLRYIGFEKVYTSPSELFKYSGRSRSRILFLEGFNNEVYSKKGSSSLIFINELSDDSPNDFPRNKDLIKKIEINLVNSSPDLSDVLREAIISESIEV